MLGGALFLVAIQAVAKHLCGDLVERARLAHKPCVATRKRPLPANAVEAIVDDIERRLMASGRPEVPSRVLGEMVITQLKMLDPIAYIRFASVYRQFVSVEDMLHELDQHAINGQQKRKNLTQNEK